MFGFQSIAKADDIKDFEIEGMSIGDSLLDHTSIKKINDNIVKDNMYKGTNYQKTCMNDYGSTYDRLCITFLNNKKKIIQALQGQFRYKKVNYKACKNKMNVVDQELSVLFKNKNKKNWGLLEFTPIPEATYHPITFDFKDQSRTQLACYNYPSSNLTVFKVIFYNSDIRKLITVKVKKK
tara:strand:+ start:68 stop:607 length:540 start_codon:yes stop_codon:yes gene_type:complete